MPTAPSPHPLPPDDPEVSAFRAALSQDLHSALRYLNQKTPYRFTGVFRFDGDMLRSVDLVDKWSSDVKRGDDLPIADAYCAHLHATGQPLEVHDGASDARTSWMRSAPYRSYSGAVIHTPEGGRWGALCHFDEAPCSDARTTVPLLVAVAGLLHQDTAFPGCARPTFFRDDLVYEASSDRVMTVRAMAGSDGVECVSVGAGGKRTETVRASDLRLLSSAVPFDAPGRTYPGAAPTLPQP